MTRRTKSAQELFSEMGAPCREVGTGLIHYLYPKGKTPDEVVGRMYAHVADEYTIYEVGRRFVLEFSERCNGSVVYRAILRDHKPSPNEIASLFESHLQGGANGVCVLGNFDELASWEPDWRQNSRDDERALQGIVGFFGLALTGLALIGTEKPDGSPTSLPTRVGLGLIGMGFLYVGDRMFSRGTKDAGTSL